MIISNSDIASFQKCERRWYYERYLGIRPKEYPEPMEVGSFGHLLMEDIFTEVLNGADYDKAIKAANPRLKDLLTDPSESSLAKSKVYKNVLAFVAYYFEQPWKVVGIEEKSTHPVSLGLEFGYTPDLRLEWTMGPKRGQQFILDYKFTGQYWNDREINLFQQVPKYIAYKNKIDGLNIRDGAVVLLNTRATSSDTGNKLFLVKWVPLNKVKLETIMRENEIMMERIKPYYTATPEHVRNMVVRTVNTQVCKLCFFADDLCPMEFEGKDVTRVMAYNYEKNEYGYDETHLNGDEARGQF